MIDLGISAIAHWALKVSDLERSLGFYRDQLGFGEMMRLHKDDGSLWLVYLRVTDTQFVELFPGGEGSIGPADTTTAVHHVCLQVEDLDRTVEALRAAGIALTSGPKMGADGNAQAWIADPDGNRIELMQMLPGNMQEKAIAALRAQLT
jgi:lactoylglutathione lyase